MRPAPLAATSGPVPQQYSLPCAVTERGITRFVPSLHLVAQLDAMVARVHGAELARGEVRVLLAAHTAKPWRGDLQRGRRAFLLRVRTEHYVAHEEYALVMAARSHNRSLPLAHVTSPVESWRLQGHDEHKHAHAQEFRAGGRKSVSFVNEAAGSCIGEQPQYAMSTGNRLHLTK